MDVVENIYIQGCPCSVIWFKRKNMSQQDDTAAPRTHTYVIDWPIERIVDFRVVFQKKEKKNLING